MPVRARAHGFAERTLRRAKKHIGILATSDGEIATWRWGLPIEEGEG